MTIGIVPPAPPAMDIELDAGEMALCSATLNVVAFVLATASGAYEPKDQRPIGEVAERCVALAGKINGFLSQAGALK
jgi:hypothetical protein